MAALDLKATNPKFMRTRKSFAPKVAGCRCTAAWKWMGENKTATMKRIGNIVESWHGTGKWAVMSIAQESLRLGSGGMFGGGIYSAPTVSKAQRYMHFGPIRKGRGWRTSIIGRDDGDLNRGYLLKCQVALGNPFVPTSTGDFRDFIASDANLYNSIHGQVGSLSGAWGGGLANGEYVVYDREQILVTMIFEYEELPKVDYVPFRSFVQPKKAKKSSQPSWMKRHPCVIRGVLCRWALDGKCLIGKKIKTLTCDGYAKGEVIQS